MSKNRPNRQPHKAAARSTKGREPIQIVVRKEVCRIPSRYVVRDMSLIVVDSMGVARVGSAVVCR
jgi:hypothetical protein